jgi:hypothetical protein
MAVTLCLPPSSGEPREIVKYLLSERKTVIAVPARHLVDRVAADADAGGIPAVWLDIATERARPVHVRFELLALGSDAPARSHLLGRVQWQGEEYDVYGAYLGPVSEEN